MNYEDELRLFLNKAWKVLNDNNKKTIAKRLEGMIEEAEKSSSSFITLADYARELLAFHGLKVE